MCGIFGSIGSEITDTLLESLRHRGPDGDGLERIKTNGGSVWLGHTRLAILDLSPAGHQPMRSQDGRWWVTFNGEIYNHRELRQELPGPFRGHSDTETLVELIATQGVEKAVPRLNGMFAFAALDIFENKLYLARDPFGVKPLYYWQQDNSLAFSSEVRALRQLLPGIGIDSEGLRRFLTLRYAPSPVTLWQGIRRLPPGHLLVIDVADGESRLHTFIEPTQERFNGSFEEATAVYREALVAAVERQMLADVPVGVLLSGGIDSALVAAMAKAAGHNPPCFTVGFGAGHGECEIDDAQQTARVLGLPFHSVTVSPQQLQEALPAIVPAVEEPLGTTSIMPMWYLVQTAREMVTVVLTGQGCDEPWGGYFRYQLELLRQRFPWILPWRLGHGLARLWRDRPDALERGLRALSQWDEAQRILEACALFPTHERCQLLDEGDGGARTAIAAWLDWLDGAGSLPGVERMMRLDTRMNLADDLLLYGDKISMAVSLEARVPMLDLELVRFIESLPIDYRIRWRQGKVIHKRMAEEYLPREIVHRPKKGFQVPFGSWSRGPWRAWVESHLLEGLEGLLRRKAVERLWREHLACQPDRSRQIFALLMLALWRQEVL